MAATRRKHLFWLLTRSRRRSRRRRRGRWRQFSKKTSKVQRAKSVNPMDLDFIVISPTSSRYMYILYVPNA